MNTEVMFEDYAINIAPIPDDEGGGYLVSFPDLPGCLADGETLEDALAEARDAFRAWVSAEWEDQGELPTPKTYSGQFVQRIPKTLHMRLAKRAASEGVSLNQLAATLLAQGARRTMNPQPAQHKSGGRVAAVTLRHSGRSSGWQS